MKKSNARIAILLLCAAALMFAFSYALVPLYDVMCKVLGLNGKTSQNRTLLSSHADTSRTIKIEFLAHVDPKYHWRFYPLTKSATLHPGQNKLINYFVQNHTNHSITIQAIASVTPGKAAKYIRKTQCFCFSQQTLKAGQGLRMPVVFHIDREIPRDIQEVTLSYALYPAPTQHGVAYGQ